MLQLPLATLRCTHFLRQRPALSRTLYTTQPVRNEPTVLTNILAGGIQPPVQVSCITSDGIQLADGLVIPSACIFLEGKVFLWDIPSSFWSGWTKDHLEIFEVVVPKPGRYFFQQLLLQQSSRQYSLLSTEILLFGTGKTINLPPPFIRTYLNALGIQLDVLDTVCQLPCSCHP